MKELKKHKLLPAKQPLAHKLLSGVVTVNDSNGVGIAYIHFSDNFVEDVGRMLPHGLSKDTPACIKVKCADTVTDKGPSKLWQVCAEYVGSKITVPLWVTDTRPPWLAKIRSL